MPTKKKRQAAKDVALAARPRTSPVFVTPMAAHVVQELPEGVAWLYELKFDGSPDKTIVMSA
jgi:ATP-dependent DNA ligase